MAEIYPELLYGSNTSDAEKKIASWLYQYLDSDYVILRNILFTIDGPVNKGGKEDREIDFLILHPKYGILVIEVKGGGVGYNSNRDEWFTYDRKNEYHKIKNPFLQAREGKHEIIRQLRKQGLWSYNTIGYAVAFPDISGVDADVIASNCQVKRELILDCSAAKGELLKCSIEKIYTSWRRTDDRPLGEDIVKKITSLYKRSWRVPSLVLNNAITEKEKLAILTEEQFFILEMLSHQSRAAIYGLAGTGKTFLAMEKARRLARRGMTVLLTCYSVKLASFLRKQISQEAEKDAALSRIYIQHFHLFVKEYCTKTNFMFRPSDYEVSYAKALSDASKLCNVRYDAIIVDEGQDFHESWWEAIQTVLSSKDNLFYIFYDNKQDIFQQETKYPVQLNAHYVLSRNSRNTKNIHKIMTFYSSILDPFEETSQIKMECLGPEGTEIEVIPCLRDSFEDQNTKLVSLLDYLIYKEKIGIENIVLLTPSKKDKSRFREGPIGGGRYYLSWEISSQITRMPMLRCSSIHKFKGLESDIVIFTELEKLGKLRDQIKVMYVAISRAILHLFVLGTWDDIYSLRLDAKDYVIWRGLKDEDVVADDDDHPF